MTSDNKPDDLGDLHAPVEDVDVPFGLQLLVFIVLLTLVGAGGFAGVMANRLGLIVIR